MTVYAEYKVYGPYFRKDGRRHVVIYKSKYDKKTVSYPKYLMESIIGRYLESNECVHHIDGDFTNDSFDNLEIVDRSEHSAVHAQVYEEINVICVGCGKEYKLTSIEHRDLENNRRNKRGIGPFCSRHCSGIWFAKLRASQKIL